MNGISTSALADIIEAFEKARADLAKAEASYEQAELRFDICYRAWRAARNALTHRAYTGSKPDKKLGENSYD